MMAVVATLIGLALIPGTAAAAPSPSAAGAPAPSASAAAVTVPSAVTVKVSSTIYPNAFRAMASATVGGKAANGRFKYYWDGSLASAPYTDVYGRAMWHAPAGLPVGDHTLTVRFLPSTAGVAASVTQTRVTIRKATPHIILSVPTNKPPYGSTTYMNVSVSGVGLGAAPGTVVLSENGRHIGSSTLVRGATKLVFPLLSTPGTNVFTVTYSGSATVAPGYRKIVFPTSRAFSKPAITSITARTTAGSFTVSVSGGPAAPTGRVIGSVDGRAVSSAMLSGGKATLALPALSPGGHTVKMNYSGDPRYKPSITAKNVSVAAPPANPCSASARACIDLTRNLSWIQENGRVIYGPVPITSGRPGYRTNPGFFTIYWRDIDHKSSIFNDAPMPYSQFFDGGIAFHEGSLYVPSHGCIHLSWTAARDYWSLLDYGDVVQVFGYAQY